MKKRMDYRTVWLFLGLAAMLFVFTGPVQAAAPTGGDVMNQLASMLNRNPADLTALLFPAGGWEPNAPANEAVLAQLYLALQTAIQNGALQGSADSLMAAAAGKAGVAEDTVKGAISYGTSLTPGAGERATGGGLGTGGFGPGGGGTGGGSSVGTQSR